jgi:hypothetical protein
MVLSKAAVRQYSAWGEKGIKNDGRRIGGRRAAMF